MFSLRRVYGGVVRRLFSGDSSSPEVCKDYLCEVHKPSKRNEQLLNKTVVFSTFIDP